jgi:murein DD-endopeptidase MepM/ murein hydrolase activator NlpD
LPTIQDCVDYYTKEKKLTYVAEGLAKYIEAEPAAYYSYKARKCYILPIQSDPDDPDSDGDGILDYVNGKHESKYWFADTNPLRTDTIWEWPIVNKSGAKHTTLTGGFRDGRAHGAIDMGTQQTAGFPVLASRYGVVTYVGTISGGGYTVKLEHSINGKTYESRYIHLENYDALTKIIDDFIESKKSDVAFKEAFRQKHGIELEKFDYIGESNLHNYFMINISANTQIGIAGNTGGNYQIHLDFQVSDKKENRSVDPIAFNQSYKISSDKNKKTVYIDYKAKENYDMFMNIPEGLQRSCSCSECIADFADIVRKYNRSKNMINTYGVTNS